MIASTITSIIQGFTDPRLDIHVTDNATVVRTDAGGAAYGVLIGFTGHSELATALGITKHDIESQVVTTQVLARDNKTGRMTMRDHSDIVLLMHVHAEELKEWKP